MFKKRRRDLLVIDRDGYAKLGTRSMEEPRMTSSLLVNVEACTQKGSYNLLGS